jgi:hypothetical protein
MRSTNDGQIGNVDLKVRRLTMTTPWQLRVAFMLAFPVLVVAAACGSSGSSNTGTPTSPTPTTPSGSFVSAVIGGQPWTSTVPVLATLTNGTLIVSASDTTPTTVGFGTQAPGPGTFTLGGNSLVTANLITPAGRWMANGINGMGSGSVTISSLSSHAASGTFTFTLEPLPGSGTTGTQSLTNGKYSVTF